MRRMTERDFQQALGNISDPARRAELRQAAGIVRPAAAQPAPDRRPRPKRGPLPASLRPSKADATAPFAVLGVVAALLFALTALASIAARLGF